MKKTAEDWLIENTKDEDLAWDGRLQDFIHTGHALKSMKEYAEHYHQHRLEGLVSKWEERLHDLKMTVEGLEESFGEIKTMEEIIKDLKNNKDGELL